MKKKMYLNKLPFHIPEWGRTECSELERDGIWCTDKAEVPEWTGNQGT